MKYRSALLAMLTCLMLNPMTLHAEEIEKPVAAQRLKVGVIVPLSGEAGGIGQAIKNGMTLGWEKLSPTARERLELLYEDDQLLPRNTLSAYRKLVSTENVHLIISAGSAAGNALAPLSERDSIPVLAIASDPEIVRNRGYIVNFFTTPEEEARVTVAEARRRGYRRIARILTTHDWPFAVKKAFDLENRSHIKVVLDEDYPSDAKDFRTFIAKLRAAGEVDAVFVLLYPGQVGIFAKQLRQQGVKTPLFAIETFEDSNEVAVSEGVLIDQWYVNADDPNNIFIDEYRRRFPGASLYGASSGHDAILLIGKAVEQSTEKEIVNRYLHTVKDFSGAMGIFSASGDNRFTLPAVVKVVIKDGFRKLQPSDL